ncbi:MAG TPA: hypothetical protein PLQ29_00065 [Spirochaetales bacterium]|nr:hypothetical protein [Spirochaetales bacterium]
MRSTIDYAGTAGRRSRPPRRGLRAAASLSWSIVAAATAAALFIGCSAAASSPGYPIFALGGRLRSSGPGAPVLADLPSGVKPRALAAAKLGPGVALAYDQGSGRLLSLDGRGRAVRSWPLEAAEAWVSDGLVLTRSAAFIEGRGFRFALYRVSGIGPERLWDGELDCFPSDVAFAAGRAYLAGGDRADAELWLWELSERGAEPLYSRPKRSDFLRVTPVGGRLLAFESQRVRERRPCVVRIVGDSPGGSPGETRDAPIVGLPGDALCLYGYGFEYGGRLVVPVALEGGDLGLAALVDAGGQFEVASLARGAKGVYLPLGPGPDGAYRYLAYDYEGDPTRRYLGRYDGSAVSLEFLGP